MSASRQKLITLAIVSTIIVSLAFAGSSAAVETAVTGDDEVERHGTLGFQSTLALRDGERVPVENFTLTIRPAGEAAEEVEVTFAPDGTILEITPSEDVVGEGEIRVVQLREALDITLADRNTEYGYGDSYGYDERRDDERVEFGYGYGYAAGDTGEATFTYDIELDSKPFKQGEYELFLSVNTPAERGLFESNTKEFRVLVPSGKRAPDEGEGESEDSSSNPGRDNGPPGDQRHSLIDSLIRALVQFDVLDTELSFSTLPAFAAGR